MNAPNRGVRHQPQAGAWLLSHEETRRLEDAELGKQRILLLAQSAGDRLDEDLGTLKYDDQ